MFFSSENFYIFMIISSLSFSFHSPIFWNSYSPYFWLVTLLVWFCLFSPIFHLFDFLLYFKENFNTSIRAISTIIRVLILWLFLFYIILSCFIKVLSYPISLSISIIFLHQLLSSIGSTASSSWARFGAWTGLFSHWHNILQELLCSFLSSTNSSIHFTPSKNCVSFICCFLFLMLVN